MSGFRNVIRWFKKCVIKILANVLLPSPTQQFELENVHKILIYGSMGIGNMILFTPTLKAIRNHFPDAHITLVVAKPEYGQVVKESSLVDEIIVVNLEHWLAFTTIRNIRGRHFDLLISNFQGLIFKRITFFSGIPYRVGHCSSPGWQSNCDHLYNIKVRMQEYEHEIDRNLRLLEPLGFTFSEQKPVLHITTETRAFAEDFLSHNGISAGDLVVGIHLGTWRSQSWKHWDMKRLAQVCDQLIEQYQAKVILLGSSKQEEELRTFLILMKHQPVIALGEVDLEQASAIIRRCDFTICNDTGLMHVSAAVGTPVIAIYGPTDYTRTSPSRYGKEVILLRKEMPCSPCYRMAGEDVVINCKNRLCLDAITVQDVIEAAERFIVMRSGKYQGRNRSDSSGYL